MNNENVKTIAKLVWIYIEFVCRALTSVAVLFVMSVYMTGWSGRFIMLLLAAVFILWSIRPMSDAYLQDRQARMIIKTVNKKAVS